MKSVDFEKYSNSWYKPGSVLKRILWHIANSAFFNTSIPFPYSAKTLLLRLFGAKVNGAIVIKPNVNIKYPWFLEIGDNVWIGEGAWIDNLTSVKIGNNVCVSQGAYILTGNHNYKKETFDLMLGPVIVEDGVWIGAKSIICPGVTLKSHSVTSVGSVITNDTEPYTIYQGMPAVAVKNRVIE